MATIATGFSDRAREIQVVRQRCLCVCAVFRDGHGKECSTRLSFCSTICADSISCLCTLFGLISSNPTRGTRAIVSLAIVRDGDSKRWGRGPFHCTLTRWPAHRLRLVRWNNPCVERHDRRDSGRPIYWTHGFGHVCGILTRWPAHRLKLVRWNNSCMERHDRRDSRGPIYWTHVFSHVCGILARWPTHRLRLVRSNNSCVERHDGRDGSRPIYWSPRLGRVC